MGWYPIRLGAEENARQEWEKAYLEEPFQLSRRDVENRRDIWDKHKSDISYDLLGAALRQKVFFYQVGTQLILRVILTSGVNPVYPTFKPRNQVSLPHFMDEKFLHEALIRYKRYLCLKKLNKATFLVPCYDIDLMWHAHQVILNTFGNEP